MFIVSKLANTVNVCIWVGLNRPQANKNTLRFDMVISTHLVAFILTPSITGITPTRALYDEYKLHCISNFRLFFRYLKILTYKSNAQTLCFQIIQPFCFSFSCQFFYLTFLVYGYHWPGCSSAPLGFSDSNSGPSVCGKSGRVNHCWSNMNSKWLVMQMPHIL